MTHSKLVIEVVREGDGYVANCPALGFSCAAKTQSAAVAALAEDLEDLEDVTKAWEEQGDEPLRDWEDVKADLGLK